MAFMKVAPEEGWNSENDDYFDGLEKLALKFEDSTYIGFFWFLSISSIVFTLAFMVIYYFTEKYNIGYWLLEYGLFGVLFIPIVGNAAQTVYCDLKLELDIANDVECFENTHYLMCVFGFLAISTALVMAASVFPVLKSDRDGVEARWQNETQFQPLHKFLLVGIILVFAPIQLPWVGIMFHVLLIAYLAVYECFKDLWVASIKMAVLWAQLWMFICAEEVDENDEDTGNDMIWGWIAFLVVGYAFLPIKSIIFKREQKIMPSQQPVSKR